MTPPPPELVSGGFYVVYEEDLAGAPPGVLEFLSSLKNNRDNARTHRNDQKTKEQFEAVPKQLRELVEQLTRTIERSIKQYGFSSEAHLEAPFWSDVSNSIDVFVTTATSMLSRQDEDMGCLFAIDKPQQKQLLPFDFDAIMVDTPAQTAENDESCHHTPLTEGQYQEWDQDNSSIEMEQVVSPPINIESLPLEYPSAQAALPNLSESDSDDLENLVQFGMNIWPEKKLD
ncbi:hypothetical protein ACKVWH_003446 [Pyricularia oryzae]